MLLAPNLLGTTLRALSPEGTLVEGIVDELILNHNSVKLFPYRTLTPGVTQTESEFDGNFYFFAEAGWLCPPTLENDSIEEDTYSSEQAALSATQLAQSYFTSVLASSSSAAASL